MQIYSGSIPAALVSSTEVFPVQKEDHFTLGFIPRSALPSSTTLSPLTPLVSPSQTATAPVPSILFPVEVKHATHFIPVLLPRPSTASIPCPLLVQPSSVVSSGVCYTSPEELKTTRRHRRAVRAAAAALKRKLPTKNDDDAEGMIKKQKRVKNRNAVAKCRSKKMAKIQEMECENDELAQENGKMIAVLDTLALDYHFASLPDPLI